MNSPQEVVTLRERVLESGSRSLYLDYTVEGKRVREFLHMYLVPEKTKIDKLQNQETMKTAQALKAKKVIAVQSCQAGLAKVDTKLMLFEFLEQRVPHYDGNSRGQQSNSLRYMFKWLRKSCPDIALSKVSRDYILRFLEAMKKELSQGTYNLYFEKFNTQMIYARRQGLIRENPFDRIESFERPHKPESTREFLTLDEVKRLMEARCPNETVKTAFLFACFTGLRISDIRELRYEDIRETGKGRQLRVRQQKTKGLAYIPLSANAERFLPNPEAKEGIVFAMPKRNPVQYDLRKWAEAAGLEKNVTFHVSRHTYATLLLTNGVDLYTVSKLLGHKDISVTQIYAKVIDQKKIEAVNAIPDV